MNYLFEAEEIKLRKVCQSDLERLLELKSESWYGTHSITLANIHDQHRWFESLDTNCNIPKNLFLIGNYKRQDIGLIKFNPIDWYNRRAEMGWDIFRELRGQGFGKRIVLSGVTFAKKVLFLHRLTAEILETNTVSQKCAENAGFVLEGIRRKEILKNMEYIDNRIYGILLN